MMRRLWRLFHKQQDEKRLDAELRFHIERQVAGHIKAGMSAEEARRRARLEFGGIMHMKVECREARKMHIVEDLVQDVRHGLRLLRKNPGFTVVAILTLALGIGANTAIFSLIDAVLLRPLAVKDAQQLAHIWIPDQKGSASFVTRYPELTNAIWQQIRQNQQGFSGVFAWGPTTFNLSRGGETRNAQALWVSGDFFNVLGVQTILGRTLTNSDDQPGCNSPGAVISYSFWQREYGGEVSALTKKISLESHTFDIIGITPANFHGVEAGRDYDVAVPLCAEPVLRGEYSQYNNPDGWWLTAMGRLKPGWTIQRAATQLRAISPIVFQAALPPKYDAEGAKNFLSNQLTATPAGSGVSELRESYTSPLYLLLGLAGMVLLITCANLANLLMARATSREKEMGIRIAVGATPGRLVKQLLVEIMLLSGAGSVCGVFLAGALGQYLVSFLSTQQDPLFMGLDNNWRVLGFTAAVALMTSVLFGLLPALRAARVSPGAVLKASGRGVTAARNTFGFRRVLVIAQVSLSFVLLIGALLFARTLRNLMVLDAGFRDNGILITNVDLTRLGLPFGRRVDFKNNLIHRIRAIPGVEAAADAEIIPISGNAENRDIFVDEATGKLKAFSLVNRVSPEFFKTLGTTLLEGRDFDEHDLPGAPLAAIVNREFARKFFAGADPLGKTFRLQEAKKPSYKIVGLAENSKYVGLRETFRAIAYMPLAQRDPQDQFDQFLIRSSLPITALIAGVKSTMSGVNPDIQIDFQVFHTVIQDSLLRERLMAALSGFFGILAAILATVGLYGVISYGVGRRKNEFGIRMALGAERTDILKMILGEAAALLGIGLGIGLVIALAAVRTASALLFGLHAYDPVTMAMGTAILAGAGIAASYIPAFRASRQDPMVALHEE
jgi:predicted permease